METSLLPAWGQAWRPAFVAACLDASHQTSIWCGVIEGARYALRRTRTAVPQAVVIIISENVS